MERDLAAATGAMIRRLCRTGEWSGPTAGVALGFVQANLVVLPAEHADDFRRFCELNPGPCPLLEDLQVGSFEPVHSAAGSDIRTDLPRYRLFEGGRCTDRLTDVSRLCRQSPDRMAHSAAFLIGCSFTFERALMAEGISIRHLDQRCNVPMYRTSVECRASGVFRGPMVVSMRPIQREHIDPVYRITARYPSAHGAPIHQGDPSAIGIRRLDRPDYGDAVTIHAGEVPVFWACGVTPIEAVIRAGPKWAITHEPGHMFVTDLRAQPLRT